MYTIVLCLLYFPLIICIVLSSLIALFSNAVFMCKLATVYWSTCSEKRDFYFDHLLEESRTERRTAHVSSDQQRSCERAATLPFFWYYSCFTGNRNLSAGSLKAGPSTDYWGLVRDRLHVTRGGWSKDSMTVGPGGAGARGRRLLCQRWQWGTQRVGQTVCLHPEVKEVPERTTENNVMAARTRKCLVWDIQKDLITLPADELFHIAKAIGPVQGKD